jgi:hypothetical protein
MLLEYIILDYFPPPNYQFLFSTELLNYKLKFLLEYGISEIETKISINPFAGFKFKVQFSSGYFLFTELCF